MEKRIGFIGLGIMGNAMAANLLKAGFPVTVFNRSAQKTATLVAKGAKTASTPKELTEATDVIIIMVTGPEAIDAIVFGPAGVAEALDGTKTLVNMSSVGPAYSRDLSVKLGQTGAAVIDAPVSGTKKPAEDAQLVILAGGPDYKIKEIESILLAMGKKVVYCGSAGQGSMMKMFINLLLGSMMEAFAEAMNFGKLGGLDHDTMMDVVASGAMNCPMFQVKGPLLKAEDYPAAFPLKHMTKDAKFLVDLAYDLGAPVPVGQTILNLYRIGVAQGWGDEDVSAIAKVIKLMSPQS